MATTEHDHPELAPADEQGEQWHGAHSDEQALREPRRSPGGVQRTVDTAAGGDHRP
jgi:hypothetical protein